MLPQIPKYIIMFVYYRRLPFIWHQNYCVSMNFIFIPLVSLPAELPLTYIAVHVNISMLSLCPFFTVLCVSFRSPKLALLSLSELGMLSCVGEVVLSVSPWDIALDFSNHLWVCLNDSSLPVLCYKLVKGWS